jgi:subtilisin-like proprotein convertase family protein
MKIFKKFFLYLFFCAAGIVHGSAQDSVLVSFPNGLSAFLKLQAAEVMPPSLQQRFPMIKIWKSTHKLFPQVDFRILKLNNEWEIYAIKGDSITKFISKKEGVWDVEVDDDFNESVKCFTSTSNNFQPLDKSLTISSNDSLSVFRLALSATGEFTDFYGGDIAKVLSVMLKMVNLVNAVFERDLGVRFVLIDRSDDLIFQFANADPFTKGNESSENQQLLDRIIGDVNYDIGHVLGGLQTVSIGKIGSVCQKGDKGRGVSTALVPDGISFIFDYFSHELAHQLGGNHTFNSVICNAQRNPLTAWEPGSGMSILGYPGLCKSDNLGLHVLPRFHSGSVEEISNLLMSKAYQFCGVKVSRSNRKVSTLDIENTYLPRNTPFLLHPLTSDSTSWFSWESIDIGVPMSLNSISGNSPNIKMTELKSNTFRSFPGMDSLVKMVNEPGVILADYERDMSLRLVRRFESNLFWQPFNLSVKANMGPFTLVKPKEDVIYSADEPLQVEWLPANTFLPPLYADKVDIFLVDVANPDALIFLKRNVPNLGKYSLFINENIKNATYKLGVKGTNKLFFNISSGKIVVQNKAGFFSGLPFDVSHFTCEGDILFRWDLSTLADAIFPLTFKIENVTQWSPGWREMVMLKPGILEWRLSAPAGETVPVFNQATLNVTTTNKIFSFPIEWHYQTKKPLKFDSVYPLNKSEISDVRPLFSWNAKDKADWYQVEISESKTFDYIIDSLVTVGSGIYPTKPLVAGKHYFWRINYYTILCGSNVSEVFSFYIKPAICEEWKKEDTLNLNQIPFRQSNLIINQKGVISDFLEIWINIKVSDIEKVKIFLKTPSGLSLSLPLPKNCLKPLQWHKITFSKGAVVTDSCISGDSLIVNMGNQLDQLKGEKLDGLWQLVFEGVNQTGNIGSWGFKSCYLGEATFSSNIREHDVLASISPNPAAENMGKLSFLKEGKASIILWDFLGNKKGEWVKSQFENEMYIKLFDLPKGIYLWDIRGENGIKQLIKWVVQ